MNTYIALLVIITALYDYRDAKILNSYDLDFKSNSEHSSLDLENNGNHLETDSNRQDLEVISDDKSNNNNIKVTILKDNENEEKINAKIESKTNNINNDSHIRNINKINVSEEALKITDIVLSEIREMLKDEMLKDEKLKNAQKDTRKAELFKFYVPISEDIVQPDYIPSVLIKKITKKKNGLRLIDLGDTAV